MSAPNTFEPLSVEADGPLTLRQRKYLYRVELSPRGSNQRLAENDTIFAWEDFLRACDRGDLEISIVDVLQFWTGSSRIPPMGFDKKLSIEFVPKRQPPPLPVAHTCGLVLELMRGYDPDVLASNMVYAIKRSGFCFLA
ncbi:uncharacterized protein LOC124270879 [Haliotis rubra]|uniref:uncharacterized protein LOC124270879 n=1 Tax=Haliotis rubra TaxID=36100 RepID=UPI001EE50AFE|nr:uncharacterized protein LOC124270879 [Haliotis rubra]